MRTPIEDRDMLKSSSSDDFIGNNLVIVKLGGSSITEKGKLETLNHEALNWVAQTLAQVIDANYCYHSAVTTHDTIRGDAGPRYSFILVHGAGSFGHWFAKQYGLQGKTQPPPVHIHEQTHNVEQTVIDRCRTFHGLARTRASVQKLNNLVVSYLIESGINAVGLSPCISYSNLQAYGGDENGGLTTLVAAIKQTLKAGLIPVLHGDAGLYGDFTQGLSSMNAGILSGDTLLEAIATHPGIKPHLSRAIFLTDVQGVYTQDPKIFTDAELLKTIEIDEITGNVITNVVVSGSTHEHDVTGGLTLKLGSAAVIASKSKVDVNIVKCQSNSAKQVMFGEEPDFGTVVRSSKNLSKRIVINSVPF